MFRRLRQGALWWWYTGHANTFSWTSEGLLDKADLDDPGFRYPPVLYAATCSFLHWDTPEISGAEQLFFNPDGVIAAVAATRPVYAARNLSLSLAVASLMSAAGHDGLSMPIGEILRQAKNTLLNNDTTKLRYVNFAQLRMMPSAVQPDKATMVRRGLYLRSRATAYTYVAPR